MEINTAGNPAQETGEYLTKQITNAPGAVLCLLSGGSALSAIEHIQLDEQTKRRTIFMMGDERWSREESENNYLQLKQLYPDFVTAHTVVDTSVQESESQDNFAARIHSTIEVTLSEHPNIFVISLVGIGEDGHTNGIFPMDKELFRETYPTDTNYTSVITSGLSLNFRASVTPTWIANNVDEIVLYAVGENKKTVLKSLIYETKELYEMPAQLIKLHPNATVFTDQEIAV
ncbi:MAG: 6-phosphogluconolactonase [Patescibacteria group bacterium]